MEQILCDRFPAFCRHQFLLCGMNSVIRFYVMALRHLSRYFCILHWFVILCFFAPLRGLSALAPYLSLRMPRPPRGGGARLQSVQIWLVGDPPGPPRGCLLEPSQLKKFPAQPENFWKKHTFFVDFGRFWGCRLGVRGTPSPGVPNQSKSISSQSKS